MAMANRGSVLSVMAMVAASWPVLATGLALAERAQQPKSETEAPQEDLSKRLDRTDGVIRPPDRIDPDIHVPAPQPNPGTTPVIPPPGTPGGDQSIEPK
jgi:hypothetical protein